MSDRAIPHFKTGLSGVLDRTISDLTAGLNGVVKNLSLTLSAQLKTQLTEVIGYPAILTIYTYLDDIIKNQHAMNNVTLQNKLVTVLNSLECTLNGLDDQSGMLRPLLEIQNELSEKYEDWIQGKLNRVAFIQTQAIKNAHARLYSLLKINAGLHGTLTDITNQMKEKLSDVVKELNTGFGQNVREFNKEIRSTINTDLPRTLKKGVFYVGLGFIATYAAYRSLFNELPPYAHAKNIGIAVGSILGIFGIDRAINWLYPSSVNRAANP